MIAEEIVTVRAGLAPHNPHARMESRPLELGHGRYRVVHLSRRNEPRAAKRGCFCSRSERRFWVLVVRRCSRLSPMKTSHVIVFVFLAAEGCAPQPPAPAAPSRPGALSVATVSLTVPPGSAALPSSAPAAMLAEGECKHDIDCTQEPDLHPCCGPEGRPVPEQMNCAVKSVDCALLRTCEAGKCKGPARACKTSADCPPVGYVHPCCNGTATKEVNCAAKKVDCRAMRSCNGGSCSAPTRAY